MQLRVERIERAAEGIVLLTLAHPGGAALPAWEPGAHLELTLPSKLIRQYSLCGDPGDRFSYTVAVLRVGDGRGGSIEIHDTGLVGRYLDIGGPRNRFPLVPASAYLLLAGGIGITPLLSMARELDRRGADWSLVYGARSRHAMAFAADLAAVPGSKVQLVAEDTDGRPDFAALLDAAAPGTAVYCCGPEAMISHVQTLCEPRTDTVAFHFERFAPSGHSVPVDAADEYAFEIELKRSGLVLHVPADRTALDVVLDAAPNHPFSCEQGECGTCEVEVLDGVVDHRDDVLNADERESNSAMMLCVSRARSARLVINL